MYLPEQKHLLRFFLYLIQHNFEKKGERGYAQEENALSKGFIRAQGIGVWSVGWVGDNARIFCCDRMLDFEWSFRGKYDGAVICGSVDRFVRRSILDCKQFYGK